jgi:hypothetical protein
MNRFLLIPLILLAGCAQLPPPAGDAAAKRFETVPDRAVIYVVRHIHDRNFAAPIRIDEQPIGTTYRATFMRLVVPSGRHQIAGMAGDSGSIELQADAGKIYYVNQTTWGYDSLSSSKFDLVDEKYGRSTALLGTLNTEYIR